MSTFDPKQAKLESSIPYPGTLYAIGIDHDQQTIYGAGDDHAVYTVDLKADKPAAVKKWTHHDNYVSSLVLLNDVIITGSYDHRLVWTNRSDGKQIRSVVAHEGWIRDLVSFPNQTAAETPSRLASVGDDMLVKVWDAATGKLLHSLEGHKPETPQGYLSALYAVAASPDGKFIASGDRIGEVRIWNADNGKLLQTLSSPRFYTYDPTKRIRSIGGIRSLCFSPDGSRLAIAGIGQISNVDGFVGPCRVELWDWQAGKKTYTGQDSHKAVMNHVAFHPTTDCLIAAGGGDAGGVITFWDMKNEKPIHKAKYKGHIQQFCLNAAGTKLYAAGHDGFQIWNLAAPEPEPPPKPDNKTER